MFKNVFKILITISPMTINTVYTITNADVSDQRLRL